MIALVHARALNGRNALSASPGAQGPELAERPLVHEQRQALPDGQLAVSMLALDALSPAHPLDEAQAALKFVEVVLPRRLWQHLS